MIRTNEMVKTCGCVDFLTWLHKKPISKLLYNDMDYKIAKVVDVLISLPTILAKISSKKTNKQTNKNKNKEKTKTKKQNKKKTNKQTNKQTKTKQIKKKIKKNNFLISLPTILAKNS